LPEEESGVELHVDLQNSAERGIKVRKTNYVLINISCVVSSIN
jgi:hypothetical protein